MTSGRAWPINRIGILRAYSISENVALLPVPPINGDEMDDDDLQGICSYYEKGEGQDLLKIRRSGSNFFYSSIPPEG